jgi:hypothetical protein
MFLIEITPQIELLADFFCSHITAQLLGNCERLVRLSLAAAERNIR